MVKNLDFTRYQDSLVPTVVQDSRNGKILMVGFCNEEALEKTEKTRKATFFSRSKKQLWTKGEISGNTLEVQTIKYDCDADTLLFLALPNGPTCHTGKTSCFFNGESGSTDAEKLWKTYETILERKSSETKEDSYVQYLFTRGLDRIAQKVGEEAIETVIASKNNDTDDFIGEFSDLLFHMMVLLAEKNIPLSDIVTKFEERDGKKSVLK